MDPPFQKTPPKSAESIRAKLESVHREAEREVTPGPYRDGTPADELLLIATFHDHECCKKFQQVLLQAGVMSQARVQRTQAQVLVDYADRQRAAELLDKHLIEFPDRPREGYRRDFDFAIFGTVLGATFGAILLYGEFRNLRALLVMVLFTVFGFVTGAMLDRPRNRYRRTGRLQFGLGDVLVLMAAVALGIVIWRMLGGRA